MQAKPRLTGIFTPSANSLKRERAIKYGRKEPESFREIFFSDTKELVAEQQARSFPLISDGQRLFGDLFRPVYHGMHGVETGSQTRWYETNGFFFPPRIVGQPEAGNGKITEYFYHDLVPEHMQVTIAGPYSLFRMAENRVSIDEERLMEAFAEQVKLIVQSLPAGVELVEFCEPSIAYDARPGFGIPEAERQKALAMAKEAYSHALGPAKLQSILQLTDGNFNQLAEDVLDFPVTGFGVDLTETVQPYSQIDLDGKILSAGILNAWSSLPEDLDFAADKTSDAAKSWRPAKVYVTTNSQLFYTISNKPAIAKMGELQELAGRLSE